MCPNTPKSGWHVLEMRCSLNIYDVNKQMCEWSEWGVLSSEIPAPDSYTRNLSSTQPKILIHLQSSNVDAALSLSWMNSLGFGVRQTQVEI